MTPDEMDRLLAQAVAAARRGPLAKPNAKDRALVAAAKPKPKRAALEPKEPPRG
jgi:hypothetical protein